MKPEESNDEFVTRLKAVQRRGLPEDLKNDLLGELYVDPSESVREAPWWMPPRWMSVGLAACWMMIIALRLITPTEMERPMADSQDERSDGMAFVERQELLASLEFGIE